MTSLEGYCLNNTKEIRKIIADNGYTVEDKHYMTKRYIDYPFIVIYNGYIQYCHERHLNRDELYGDNKKLEFINNNLYLKIT